MLILGAEFSLLPLHPFNPWLPDAFHETVYQWPTPDFPEISWTYQWLQLVNLSLESEPVRILHHCQIVGVDVFLFMAATWEDCLLHLWPLLAFVILTKAHKGWAETFFEQRKRHPFFPGRQKPIQRDKSWWISGQVKSTLICPSVGLPWWLSSSCIHGVVLAFCPPLKPSHSDFLCDLYPSYTLQLKLARWGFCCL